MHEGRVALEEDILRISSKDPRCCAYVLEFVAKEKERKKGSVASSLYGIIHLDNQSLQQYIHM